MVPTALRTLRLSGRIRHPLDYTARTSVEEPREFLLPMEEPSAATVRLFEGAIRLGPELAAELLRSSVKRFVAEETVTGRPTAIPDESYPAICLEVSTIELKGKSLAQAKKIVAKKYSVNTRTIHRIWSNRALYPTDGITVAEAKAFVSSMLKRDSNVNH